MEALSGDQVKTVLAAMKDTPIYTQVVVLLSTGLRRGELMGLQWNDVDLEAGKLRVERSMKRQRPDSGESAENATRTPPDHLARLRRRRAPGTP